MSRNKLDEIELLKEKIENENKENESYVLVFIKKYDNLINKVSYKVKTKCSKLEFDDVKQQIILVLLSNVKMFDASKNAAPSTYFTKIVFNAASNIVKKYWQIKNKANIECVSIDSLIKEDDDGHFIELLSNETTSPLQPENYYIQCEFSEKLNMLLHSLSEFERNVFKLYLAGKDIDEIAIIMKKNKKTIYNVLAAIKSRIKTHY
ncbi:MAG: sigma-70 family RNA polymerase sigma factor [Erysipelotrichaceae bacterium]|nr:sigma-70 family RNA polymerase sigma factor [Erysipelotrichaceae bacterium]